MRPVRFGVLGCSSFAVRRMLPAMAATPGVALTAVASRDPAKADSVAREFGAAAVTGYAPLLERADVDAVYVPLPNALHAEWVDRALRAGRHVLAEKPLTTSYDSSARLVALARERGLALVENFMFVHHPQHHVVRSWLDAGELGETRVFSAAFGIPPRDPDDVRYQRGLGGGALLDVGVYPIRAAQLFLAGPLSVVGAHLHVDPRTGVDTRGHVLLRAATGATAELSFGFEHSYRSSYEIWGSAGRVRVDRAYTPPPHEPRVLRLHRQDRVHEREVAPADQAVALLTAFAAAVRAGGYDAGPAEAILNQAALVERIGDAAADIARIQ